MAFVVCPALFLCKNMALSFIDCCTHEFDKFIFFKILSMSLEKGWG